jgi:hypothetical protein
MGTLTINVKDDIEQEFRMVAGTIYGKKKGYLGKAITEAMQNWVYERRQERIAKEALDMMKQDFFFGKRLYQRRSDLYER